MRVFVAGASGVLGRQLVPQLEARGHEVVGMTRSESKQDLLRSLGARPVVANALDPDAVAQVVASAEPEVLVHQLTALSGKMSIRDARHPDRSSMGKMTNRLRTEGTDHLFAAGRAVGARRFVAQSFGAFRFARTGGAVQTKADPLDPDPLGARQPGLEAILYLEQAVTTIEWGEALVLRYGGFYGPGTGISLAPDAVTAAPIRPPARSRARSRWPASPGRPSSPRDVWAGLTRFDEIQRNLGVSREACPLVADCTGSWADVSLQPEGADLKAPHIGSRDWSFAHERG
jgi:nucleoside-diphosphate-sugar epimerase